MQNAYVLISPCKDEAEYLERNLKSIEAQTVKPAQWVIVDDGSSDDGMEIVARYQERMPFIKVIRRDSGARAVGGGVVRAFEDGLAAVDVDYDFLCKFDVDLDMPPLVQAEAIGFARRGNVVWIGTEKLPAPLVRLDPPSQPTR